MWVQTAWLKLYFAWVNGCLVKIPICRVENLSSRYVARATLSLSLSFLYLFSAAQVIDLKDISDFIIEFRRNYVSISVSHRSTGKVDA